MDLLPILTSILESKAFKDRYLGLLVLFDEFGDTMKRGNIEPQGIPAVRPALHRDAGQCRSSGLRRHRDRDLTWYAKAYNATDFRVASDRIEAVPLGKDGLEDHAAIVTPQKQSALWQNEVAARSAVFDGLLTDCTRLKLFDWLKGPKVRQAIIEDIYPMHPMATYALLAAGARRGLQQPLGVHLLHRRGSALNLTLPLTGTTLRARRSCQAASCASTRPIYCATTSRLPCGPTTVSSAIPSAIRSKTMKTRCAS